MRVSRAERAANYLILSAFAVFALFPILTIVVAALGPDDSGSGTASASVAGVHVGNFAQAWQIGHFGTYLRTSLTVSVLVVAVSLVLSILSGFAFGTMRFRGSTVLFYLFLLGIMMPSEAIVVPLYFDLRSIGLTNTLWAIALPQIAQSVAFGTFWMRAYFRSSSRAIVEAARLDGASNLQIAWRIKIPLVVPAIILTGVFSIIGTLQLLAEPQTLRSFSSAISSTFTPNLAVYTTASVPNYNLAAAFSVVLALATFVLSFVFLKATQRKVSQ